MTTGGWEYSRADLVSAIADVGIGAGDTVSLQVSLGRVGTPHGVAKTVPDVSTFVIETFLDVLGPRGTLVVQPSPHGFAADSPVHTIRLQLGANGDGAVERLVFADELDLAKGSSPALDAIWRKSGLVEARRDGIWMHYRLAPIANPVVAAVIKAALHALTHTAITAKDEKRLHVALQAS